MKELLARMKKVNEGLNPNNDEISDEVYIKALQQARLLMFDDAGEEIVPELITAIDGLLDKAGAEEFSRGITSEKKVNEEEKDVYTLEAGRGIVKNGTPIAHLDRIEGCGKECYPTESDAMAHFLVDMLNANDFQAYYTKYMES